MIKTNGLTQLGQVDGSRLTGLLGVLPRKEGKASHVKRLSSLDLCVVIFEIKEFNKRIRTFLKMSFMIIHILTVLDLSRGLQVSEYFNTSP